jgi:hypothetical protein
VVTCKQDYVLQPSIEQLSGKWPRCDPGRGLMMSTSGLERSVNLACVPKAPITGFVRPSHCPQPKHDFAIMEIVDAWISGPKVYGWAAKIIIQEAVMNTVDKKRGFSILIRMPEDQAHRGSLQLWNMRFFNTYQNGKWLLLHSKWWDSDRLDDNSFLIVAEGLSTKNYPKVDFFNGRVSDHSCFQKMTRSGMSEQRRGLETAIKNSPRVNSAGDVTKIVWNDGQVKAVRGQPEWRPDTDDL